MEHMESMMNNRLEASMSEYEQMTDRIKELESQLAEAKKDQARYQWLRNEVLVDGEINDSLYVACGSVKYIGRWALVGDELDQAIDAAIKEQGK